MQPLLSVLTVTACLSGTPGQDCEVRQFQYTNIPQTLVACLVPLEMPDVAGWLLSRDKVLGITQWNCNISFNAAEAGGDVPAEETAPQSGATNGEQQGSPEEKPE
jgi:hypothetical protein